MKILTYIFYGIIALAAVIACEKGFTDSESFNDSSSGKGGSMARFAIALNKLYTVTNEEMKLFDISNASTPQLQDSVDLGFGIETIFPYGDKLFIGSTTGMHIYDISNPASPEKLSLYQHVFSCDPVVVEGDFAYVTLNSLNTWCGRSSNQLDIIDISNLYYPHLIKEYSMEGPLGLGIDNNLLFVCDNGLKVYDVADKYNIELLYHFKIEAHDVIPLGNKLLVIGDDGLYQYSYSKGELNLLSKIPTEKSDQL